jgi:uncharacterized protein (TIGR00299 family) protein
MTLLYCDCFSGISGDMFLGALLDAGLPADTLTQELLRLGLPGFRGAAASQVQRGAMRASLLEFEIEEVHEHKHEQEQNHRHEHEHVHSGQRNLGDITAIIEASGLPDEVVRLSTGVFHCLAEAEAKVHGSTIEDVHFHEVGAVDSILDIVGAAVGLHYFKVEQVYASGLPWTTGQVQTQHGTLPLPAPATLELLTSAHAPVVPSAATLELVTPTGAALLACLAKFEQPAMTLSSVGVGAGRRELPWPNVLRVILGEANGEQSGATHVEIETNIDDMNPQFFGHVMGRLLESGALDVYFTPIMMKKNRPATRLSVIARREDEQKLCDLLLRETSTLGVRVQPVRRHEAERRFVSVPTRFGEVQVKLKILAGQVVQASPEYEDCAALARALDLPVAQVYNEALQAAYSLLT